MPEAPRRDETAFEKVLRAIEAGHVRVYRNLLNQPYVFCDHPQYPSVHMPLSDPDVRAWLVHFVRGEAGILLHIHEANRIITELAGRSMANRIGRVADEALTRLLESEPVVAVTYEFMFLSPKNPYEQKGERLWEELWDFAEPRALLSLGRRRFPGGPQVLSRRLKGHAEALRLLGIEVVIRRSNGCIITLRRLDASTAQPSAEASAAKHQQGQELRPEDDAQARARRLEAKKKRQPPEGEKR